MKDNITWYQKLLFSFKYVYIHDILTTSAIPDLHLDGVKFYKLQIDDIADIVEFNIANNKGAYFSTLEEVRKRLDRRHICYVAEKNGEILGYSWFAINDQESPDLDCSFVVNNDSVIAYNVFVAPKFRGMSIMPGITSFAFNELNAEGYIHCYSYTLSTNMPVLRMYGKFHSRIIGRIICCNFMGYYFFIPVLKRYNIKVVLNVSPWHHWKRALLKRL